MLIAISLLIFIIMIWLSFGAYSALSLKKHEETLYSTSSIKKKIISYAGLTVFGYMSYKVGIEEGFHKPILESNSAIKVRFFIAKQMNKVKNLKQRLSTKRIVRNKN